MACIVLEDAAPALGAEIEGRKVGSFGHVAAFSFQGAKIMTCGEGGMLVTSDQALYERAKYMNDHGRDPHKAFVNTAIGYKYKMSNLQAALGLGQLERIEEMIAKRRLIFQWYRQRLGGLSELTLNVERFWARNIYWMTSIVLGDEARDRPRRGDGRAEGARHRLAAVLPAHQQLSDVREPRGGEPGGL